MADKSAIVTGSSSGIGEAICLKLLSMGYTVHGIARREQTHIQDTRFHPTVCDITDTVRLEQTIKKILEQCDIDLLIHSAGLGRFEPHEELSPLRLKQIIDTNLTAPVILSSLTLRSLKKKKGTIINITSIEALKASKFSAAYSASKAGLHHFGRCLFEEVRKSGVNVISIHPDMTQTPFFDELHFKPAEELQMHLKPADIAKAIEDILNMREGVSITELTIRPQYFGIKKK